MPQNFSLKDLTITLPDADSAAIPTTTVCHGTQQCAPTLCHGTQQCVPTLICTITHNCLPTFHCAHSICPVHSICVGGTLTQCTLQSHFTTVTPHCTPTVRCFGSMDPTITIVQQTDFTRVEVGPQTDIKALNQLKEKLALATRELDAHIAAAGKTKKG